ncbi:Uncharacterised protein [uncultured archaeon]|nr:Uncharacterised protein [uncultured archaeon]
MTEDTLTKKELERLLAERIVYDILLEIHSKAQRWQGGGASIHRARGAGYLAEAGAYNIREGRTPITNKTTFREMKKIATVMYWDTLNFIGPIVQSKIYSP